jgi:hypothetical protein
MKKNNIYLIILILFVSIYCIFYKNTIKEGRRGRNSGYINQFNKDLPLMNKIGNDINYLKVDPILAKIPTIIPDISEFNIIKSINSNDLFFTSWAQDYCEDMSDYEKFSYGCQYAWFYSDLYPTMVNNLKQMKSKIMKLNRQQMGRILKNESRPNQKRFSNSLQLISVILSNMQKLIPANEDLTY